jgi:hypothetical protein
MRKRINSRVEAIEKLRLDNKLGKVIRLLGDGDYTCINFSTLRGEDGRTRTTSADVTKLLENFFGDWFLVPSALDPAALAIEDDQTLWQELVDTPPHIKEHMHKPNGVLPPIHPDSKIPKDPANRGGHEHGSGTGVLFRGAHCGYQTPIQ